MKKVLFMLLAISALVLPARVEAKSYNYNYSCGEKMDLGDGTFYMTCQLGITADFEINHITGRLDTKNVYLQSITMGNGWVNNNGISNTIDFSSPNMQTGTINIATLVFTGNLSDEECSANFIPDTVETQKVTCAIVDGEYYGKNGSKVSEETYLEECCTYKCAIIDNKYYFDSNGKSVSYEQFMNDCNTTTNPQTGNESGLIAAAGGVLAIIAILKLAKKNTKIYKI